MQAVFDDLLVRYRGVATADDEAAVRHGRVIARQLLGADEVHRGVVLVEVMRHGDDGLAHGFGVGAALQHHEAFARVLLARAQAGPRAAAHLLHGGFHRHGVLHGAGHTRHAAQRVGVPLAQPLAPEGVSRTVGQQGLAIDAVDGEQARIPAGGDQRGGLPGARGRIDGGEVLRHARMGVEAVHDAKTRRQFGRLRRQIVLGAAAQHQHIQLAGVGGQIGHAMHGCAGGQRLEAGRVAAGVDGGQAHVGVVGHGGFHAAPEVAVPDDADANGGACC